MYKRFSEKKEKKSKKRLFFQRFAVVFLAILVLGIIVVSFLTIYEFCLTPPIFSRVSPVENILRPQQESAKVKIFSFLKHYRLKELKGEPVSFTEIFDSEYWKDEKRTTAHEDFVTNIISFPPKYQLTEFFPKIEPDVSQNSISSNQQCLPSGECLILDGSKVYLKTKNGKKWRVFLSFLPKAIGKTESFWLIADSKKADNKFQAVIYKFDGKILQKLAGKEFFQSHYPSDYPGRFILGGKDDDFLAGFWGWDSKILRFVSAKGSPFRAYDVSFWFSTKLTSRLLRVKNLKVINSPPGYVFYVENPPVFLLVNSNFLLNLTDELNLKRFQKVFIKPLSAHKFLFVAQRGEKKKFYIFEDLGFDKSKPVSFVSSNLLRSSGDKGEKIVAAVGLEYLGSQKGGGWQFFFSQDGAKSWKKAKLGETVYFEPKSNPDFRWRVDFIPVSGLDDDFYSPFLYEFSMTYGTK